MTSAPVEDDLLSERVPDVFSCGDHGQDDVTVPKIEQNDCTMKLEDLSVDNGVSLSPLSSHHPNKLLHHSLPVTCLKLLDGIVLVASEGPSILMKMAYFNDHPFQRYQLFPSQVVISGMEFIEAPVLECGDDQKSDKLCDHIYVGYVWAGSLATLVRVTRSVKKGISLLEYTDRKDKNKFFNLDFIPVAAKWLDGGNILVLLSVLNYIVIFERTNQQNSPTDFSNLREVTRVKCSKSETLFSGTISGNSRSSIRVFAGTVFNGIIVWDLDGDQHTIKHELKCHNGIIFGLEYYANRNVLLSTSDDRTVAVWQFSKDNGKEEVKLLHRFYGHDARVWKALSVHGYIVSVGESSEVRVNILKDGKAHKTWKAHDGAPIFTCVYDEDVDVLYTGGNDGAIRKWAKWWYQLQPHVLPYDVVQIDPDTEGQPSVQVNRGNRWSGNKDFPKMVVLLDINHILVSMECGRVLALSWEGKQYDLLHDPHCEGYQIIKISPDHKTLAVAGNNGHFYTAQISFSKNQSSKLNVLHAKKIFMTRISWNIITMIWLDVSRLLIICLNRAIALLLQENEAGERSEVEFIQTFNLNLQRPGVPAAVEIFGKYIAIGDETGSLHLLRYHKTNEAIQKFDNAHKDGCTNLMFHESKLYSSGRDGKIRCFEIQIDSDNDLKAEFIPLCSYIMPFEWTTGIYVNMGEMLCCGFQKEDFLVYSMNENRTLVKIPCGGGGNRKWDFKYGHGKEGSPNASFAFVKDKEVFYTFLPMEGHLKNTLKDGLHSRTINCALQMLTSSGNKIDYISGSEDGSLKWFQWDTVNQSILSVQSMENHVSSVRSAWKITNASNQVYLFTGGGRSQLCIYKIDLINRRLEPLKEIILVKTTFKQIEGDVRIMDIVVSERAKDELWCFSACSDGIVRVVYYNTKTNKFKIAALLNGNAHAVMRLQLLSTSLSNDRVFVVGVTSNGYLFLWTWCDNEAEGDLTIPESKSVPEKTPEFQVLLRRTAFLSMKAYLSAVQDDCENHKIVCGGDDCSVGVWTLTINKGNDGVIKCAINEDWIRDQIQRGAVVGVEIDDKSIYSLSNDQIVGVWDMNGNLQRKAYAGVSDCQGFVMDGVNKCIMCYGKGISWIPINS